MTPATTEQPVTDKATATCTIMERSVCLVLHCSYLGNQRKVDLASAEVLRDGERTAVEDADELTARVKLFSDADLRPARAAVDQAKKYVDSISLDGAHRIFGAGARLVPILAVQQADERLAQIQADVLVQAELLAQRVPDLVAARRGGATFDAKRFPSPDEVRRAFAVDWSYVSFGAPDRLQDVDRAAYLRAVAQHESRMAEAYQDVIAGLRQSAALVMRVLAERLRPGEDGKPKALRPTALRDLQDLLERLPVLNSVGEDTALAGLLARVGAAARGLDVGVLRENGGIRAMLLATAEQAAAQLDALVETGRRAMRLGPAAA